MYRRRIRTLHPQPALHPRLRPPERKAQMILNILLLVVSALILVYLVIALLRPEKF
jgi:K+-transporting ATPase KdpF subunit